MLVIQKEVLEWTNLTEQQLLEEIAVMLYQQKKLTFGQAAKTANLNYVAFQFVLGKHKVPTNYDVSEFLEDLETIKTLKKNGNY